MTATAIHKTKISTWGNSEAVRIPRKLLAMLGIGAGDRVDITINERNNIEISRNSDCPHRQVKPSRGITYETLFSGWTPGAMPSDPWSGIEPIGAEIEAWNR